MSRVTNPSFQDIVYEFQRKFHQSYDGPPRELPASLAKFRKDLLQEELDELKLAIDRGELHEQLDALVDLLYVVVGTSNLMGFREVLERAFWRVHSANMAKVLAPSRLESKRDSAWDIVKPPGWEKPDLRDLVYRVVTDEKAEGQP